MEFLKKIMKNKKSQDKKSTIKKNKKIKLEKKPLKKEIPKKEIQKKEKPPVEIKLKGKRGRPKNPETKKIAQQTTSEQKPLTASQNAAAEIIITKVAKQESDKKIYKLKITSFIQNMVLVKLLLLRAV